MARPAETPLAGGDVPEQRRLRAPVPTRDLDEFLAFLDHLRALFPKLPARRRSPTTGDRFLL